MEDVKELSAYFCGHSLIMCGPPHKKHPSGFGALPFGLDPLGELFFFCSPSSSFSREYFGGRLPEDCFLFLGSLEKTKSMSLSATAITLITSATFHRCSSC